MAFVKEFVSEEDKEFYNSLEMYDYDRDCIHRWGSHSKWLIDRERNIFFTYVSGGPLEHPLQYDLIWKGYKIVIMAEVTSNLNTNANPPERESIWNILSIKAPIELKTQISEMLEIIKKAIEHDHSIDIIKGGQYIEATSKLVFAKITNPIF